MGHAQRDVVEDLRSSYSQGIQEFTCETVGDHSVKQHHLINNAPLSREPQTSPLCHSPASKRCGPPSDPCVLPKALRIVEAVKDVSHPAIVLMAYGRIDEAGAGFVPARRIEAAGTSASLRVGALGCTDDGVDQWTWSTCVARSLDVEFVHPRRF